MKGQRFWVVVVVAVAALAIALVAGVGLAVSVFAEPEVLPTPTVTPHCKWEWGNVEVTVSSGHTILEAVLTSNGAQAHSYTEWDICFDCEDITSFQFKTASDPTWTDADYECGDGVLKLEETFGPSDAPITIRIEVEGSYDLSTQSYTLKAGQEICTGQMGWFYCPPTAVGLGNFAGHSGWRVWFDRVLELFGLR